MSCRLWALLVSWLRLKTHESIGFRNWKNAIERRVLWDQFLVSLGLGPQVFEESEQATVPTDIQQ